VLFPERDSAARVALACYGEATRNTKTARYIRALLKHIHDTSAQRPEKSAINGEKMSDRKVKENIWIPLLSLAVAIIALFQSCSANRLSKDISDLTNRPYILIEDIEAKHGLRSATKEEFFLPVEYKFNLVNNGTLPAWIIRYDIYVNGTNGPIHMLFGPEIKPTKNFTIGTNAQQSIEWYSPIKQKLHEKNEQVDSFEAQKHKMILITVSYRTIGDTEGKNVFTTWQLAKFGMRKNIECGTNALSEDKIKRLFEEQEEIFERNEPK
jgi:hypothetical protein